MVKIDEQSCIGCGACTDACPQHILYLDGSVCRVSEQKKCQKCRDCESVCPTEAIQVSKPFNFFLKKKQITNPWKTE